MYSYEGLKMGFHIHLFFFLQNLSKCFQEQFYGTAVLLHLSAFFIGSQMDLLPSSPVAQAPWVLCERGWVSRVEELHWGRGY